MTRLVIRNDQELTAAIERADALMGCTNDCDEERELAAIVDAIDYYQEALTLERRVAEKITARPPRGTPSSSGIG